MKFLFALAAVVAVLFAVSTSQSDVYVGTVQPTIYVINHSSIPNETLLDAMTAFQMAVDYDFRKYWNVGAKLVFATEAPPRGWYLELDDQIENCICGGYHAVTDGFIPYGKVLADDQWQIAFTHELFELLADPHTNRAIVTPGDCDTSNSNWPASPFDPPGRNPCTVHWLEVSDPVEAFSYTRPGASGASYQISDFITERWYRVSATRGPFDYMGLVKRPLQILDGGYEGYYHKAI